jgi:Methyltransferase domain
VLTWTSEDAFELGDTTYVCRPIEGRFASEPGRFCLLKPRHEVEWYERFLRDRAPRSIIEVGSYDGASSAFFAEIARPKTLVTIDRRPTPSPALADFIDRRGFGDVITPYYGVDQSDAPRLREILDEAFAGADLDLVVDDASHLVEPTRATFNCLFPRLAAGGTYLIEDWSWAHSGLGTTWPDERPLTSVIFQLILACASRPKVVSNVNVFKNYTLVERGPAPIDADSFDLAQCFGPRAAALIAE